MARTVSVDPDAVVVRLTGWTALAALKRGSVLDQAIRALSVAGHAIPPFWLGLLFVLTLGVQLRLFPVGGMLTIGASDWDLGDRLAHLVGPVLTLSLAGIANYTRYLRTEVLDVLAQDYVRTARAKGLRDRAVLMRHALRNALIPIVTVIGINVGILLGGSAVIETVFVLPGVGQLVVRSLYNRDLPVIQGLILYVAVIYVTVNLAVDVLYTYLDPRLRPS